MTTRSIGKGLLGSDRWARPQPKQALCMVGAVAIAPIQDSGLGRERHSSYNEADRIQAVEADRVGKDDIIVLNVTGGGEKRLKKEKGVTGLKPTLLVDGEDDMDKIIEVLS